jgi:hypothetical protein
VSLQDWRTNAVEKFSFVFYAVRFDIMLQTKRTTIYVLESRRGVSVRQLRNMNTTQSKCAAAPANLSEASIVSGLSGSCTCCAEDITDKNGILDLSCSVGNSNQRNRVPNRAEENFLSPRSAKTLERFQ